MFDESIVISEIDFVRLNKLIKEEAHESFNEILDEADITNCSCIPQNLVTMNTKISYLRISDQKVSELRIVYPHNADLSQNLISVLSPLGRSFIGRYEGELVDCTLPSGETTSYKILKVLYQPEAHGDFHL